MANKVKIFENTKNNTYLVQAFSINKGDEELLVPSPFGNDFMIFDSLEDAIKQIKICGYEYAVVKNQITFNKTPNNKIDYDKIVDVLIKNLDHENLEIRKSSINSLSKFGVAIADRLISILQTDNRWLLQQSIVKCIEKIITSDKDSIPVFLPSLIEISESDNTMIKSAALKAIEKICDFKNN